ncbi:MAG: methyltransferase domain-containing protein [Verrucomicrobiota bacterium]|jgi:SAM-dependent methyltransferase
MRFVDRLGQRWRIDKIRPFIPGGARVLDIGSGDGALFRQLGKLVNADSLGIDPGLKANSRVGGVSLIVGKFPQDMPAVEPFDVITLLAVLEHFPPAEHAALKQGCRQFLKPGGRLIITVPSAHADYVLAVMTFFRLHDGMSLEEHHGYDVEETPKIFSGINFRLSHRKKFELGLNNLFVFERIGDAR